MISRLISLTMAIGLSLTLLFAAPLFADKIQGAGRGILMLGLIGISGGFVHGVGFEPRSIFFKFLFNPWISRILMACTLFFYW
ncbi:MAG: cyd operon YbgE family protein [Alphaproteobacteria bacterium]|jgi:cyd operon protein YbgE|nr:cyd operon YbgE family protein [Alphaproteobacteria bacterium]